MDVRYNDRDSRDDAPLPLEGIKVVEYGVFHAGPGGGAILGDLGAEVIKVEDPVGDGLRYWTKVGALDMAGPDGRSMTFEVSNRNKKNICLNIKEEAGREIFNQLIRDEWMADFMAARLMFAPIQKVTDVENDIQAKANAYVRPAQYPGLGEVNLPGYTASFGKCRPGIRTRGADKGEQTDHILQSLGYGARDIEALKEKEVVQ